MYATQTDQVEAQHAQVRELLSQIRGNPSVESVVVVPVFVVEPIKTHAGPDHETFDIFIHSA